MTFFLIALAVILGTIGLVKLVDKFIPSKLKPVLTIALWLLIAFLGYQTYMSIYEPIKFNKEKNKRYAVVIESLIDIRDAQLAHRQVTGKFAKTFDGLIKFIDTAEYTLTQRRDSSVIDKELTRRYGVDTTKDIVIIDTLGTVPVKDSLFKSSNRYKTMMNVPVGQEGAKFKMDAGFVEQNNINIPVFEASVKKDVLLYDQNRDLVIQENQIISVDGVNGDALKVGSMDEVKTGGNWPKTYGDSE
ncbi:hypothetical protein FPF71_16510 [Algibacter amylolyticus]|uniref:Uncharacterized protein n=1 Tax=Algibacter amylolyticus TaxID=1608400 RepID=A0A5M7AZL6_9FLAO|nr:hypothetical protein [Algibacter amylolyticus]KAA5821478.1 hypothetical protein F2B50_16510 [Algibacter amylolyticus]MBB5268355.1 hypothetical protein [Algibacter amylolyticus]TSJ72990.1 hypothetical protein FPF71_16510 [Algibacter amylolyticus]